MFDEISIQQKGKLNSDSVIHLHDFIIVCCTKSYSIETSLFERSNFIITDYIKSAKIY